MYIWEIELEEHWTYMDKGEFEDCGTAYTIAAKDADQAFAKAKKLATSKSRGYSLDEDGNESNRGERRDCTDVRIIKIERGTAIDA